MKNLLLLVLFLFLIGCISQHRSSFFVTKATQNNQIISSPVSFNVGDLQSFNFPAEEGYGYLEIGFYDLDNLREVEFVLNGEYLSLPYESVGNSTSTLERRPVKFLNNNILEISYIEQENPDGVVVESLESIYFTMTDTNPDPLAWYIGNEAETPDGLTYAASFDDIVITSGTIVYFGNDYSGDISILGGNQEGEVKLLPYTNPINLYGDINISRDNVSIGQLIFFKKITINSNNVWLNECDLLNTLGSAIVVNGNENIVSECNLTSNSILYSEPSILLNGENNQILNNYLVHNPNSDGIGGISTNQVIRNNVIQDVYGFGVLFYIEKQPFSIKGNQIESNNYYSIGLFEYPNKVNDLLIQHANNLCQGFQGELFIGDPSYFTEIIMDESGSWHIY